jgi:hypothetical protein
MMKICTLGLAVLTCICHSNIYAQVSISGKGNRANNIVTGNNNKISSTTINKRTVVNNTYNIYYMSPLTETDKEQLSSSVIPSGNNASGRPSILVFPKSSDPDIYHVLNEPDTRISLTKVRQAFLDQGYNVIPYPNKDAVQQINLQGKKANDKSKGIFLSGADVCVEVDVIKNHDGDESSVTVIMDAYVRKTGSLIAEKSETSNAFRTNDYGLLLESVVPQVTEEIITAIRQAK